MDSFCDNICKWPQSYSGSKRLQTDHWINMNGAALPLLAVCPRLSAIHVHLPHYAEDSS